MRDPCSPRRGVSHLRGGSGSLARLKADGRQRCDLRVDLVTLLGSADLLPRLCNPNAELLRLVTSSALHPLVRRHLIGSATLTDSSAASRVVVAASPATADCACRRARRCDLCEAAKIWASRASLSASLAKLRVRVACFVLIYTRNIAASAHIGLSTKLRSRSAPSINRAAPRIITTAARLACQEACPVQSMLKSSAGRSQTKASPRASVRNATLALTLAECCLDACAIPELVIAQLSNCSYAQLID